jgi:hypothetical protein
MKISLEMDPTDKILAKRKMGKDKSAQRFFTSTVRRHSDKYVPMLSGVLKNTAKEGDNYILYDTPYAAENYYHNRGRGLQGTSNGGLRGKEWDKRMMASEGKTVVKELADYVGGKTK